MSLKAEFTRCLNYTFPNICPRPNINSSVHNCAVLETYVVGLRVTLSVAGIVKLCARDVKVLAICVRVQPQC